MQPNIKTYFRLILFFFIYFFINAETVPPNADILFWLKNRPLMFSDFKGNPQEDYINFGNRTSENIIHKLGTISKSIDLTYINSHGSTTFNIYAGMNTKDSWIKNKNDTITLKHEQGHFDICEIYARILRRDIKKAKTIDEAKKIYENISEAENIEQDKYDQINTFELGGITKTWKDTIYNRLKILEVFQKPIVIVPIYK